jgi:hypothetical protein
MSIDLQAQRWNLDCRHTPRISLREYRCYVETSGHRGTLTEPGRNLAASELRRAPPTCLYGIVDDRPSFSRGGVSGDDSSISQPSPE